MATKISSSLEPEVMAKAALGWSTRKIAEWLANDHGIAVGHNTVAKLLEKRREERAAIAKTVVREKLVPEVCKDIDILNEHQLILHQMAKELISEPEIYFKAVEQLRKITDTKLHYSGADTPDDSLSELAAAHARVKARLARLALDVAEAGAQESDRPN